MPLKLDARKADFGDRFDALVELRREETADVRDAVTAILADVRAQGDAALKRLTAKFDRLDLADRALAFSADEIATAKRACPNAQLEALELAASRIRSFHESQLPERRHWRDEMGVALGLVWTPIDAVGLYVPGGTAAYPSSVLMNAIPAKVAGCKRLVMVVPTPDGAVNPLVLAAADIAGVDEIYRIGGAQAVAALAYGTQSISPVDKIVGPGNAYVAEAKRQVFGRVGIDMIAGPSEIVVVAQGNVDPAWIAADLLSQAEHDEQAQAILITPEEGLARAVESAVEEQLASLQRRSIAQASWRDHGAIIVVDELGNAPALIDRLAPEHLELMVDDPAALAQQIHHAGAIFMGAWTPEVVGDYVGGPNHVLPTSRTARFASGLAVFDFLKRTTYLGCDATNFRLLAGAASTLARAEGLEAHALAVERRLRPGS